MGLTTPTACGDPLLSATASASPLFVLDGYVQPFPVDLSSPRVSVVWVDPQLGSVPDVAAAPDTLGFTIDAEGAFRLQLFSPPPPTAGAASLSNGANAQFAWGEIVLYDDVAGVGSPPIGPGNQLAAPDTYRGATPDSVLIYIDSMETNGTTALWPILSDPAGYHLGMVGCNTFSTPVIENSPNADGVDAIVTLQVVAPTSQLPYLRTCLQSHPLTGS